MPYATGAIDAYRQTEIQSRTPVELVAMLYDGLLRSMGDARAAIGRKDIASRGESIGRALAIVSQLQSTLDMQAGGEIARSLDSLYAFVTSQLLEATSTQEAAPLDAAVRVITPLHEAWTAIAAHPAGEVAAP